MTVDELESLRLADYLGLYHEEAAERMNVSRQTFGRIVETARRKVAQTLVEGLVLRIEGGEIEIQERTEMRTFRCYECQHLWQVPYGTGRPEACPACKSTNIHRFDRGGGPGRHGRAHRHRGGCRARAVP